MENNHLGSNFDSFLKDEGIQFAQNEIEQRIKQIVNSIENKTCPPRSLYQLPIEIAEKLFKLQRTDRLKYFEEIQEYMADDLYWTILRALWIDDGICTEQWEKLIYADRKRQHKIMKSSDRQALKKLPKVMPIYRACDTKEDSKKFNWTTDPMVAVKMHKKIIATQKIKKSDIYAYFNSRREQEVILKKGVINEATWKDL